MFPLVNVARALVLAPHTDDEMGCAGTIRRLVHAGVEVRYVALSRCEESVPAGFPKDVLEHECRACLAALGVKQVEVWEFKVRHFPASRQEILERFVAVNRAFKPDLVLLPSQADIHQDHATVATEGVRAFKHSTVLGYELLQNITNSTTNAFIELDAQAIADKLAALSHYKSQAGRTYCSREVIEGQARVRGMQCNASFAEAFEIIRLTSRLKAAAP